MLTGWSAETATVDQLLVDARSSRSGVLVIRGEAGIGKSALLDHAAATATDMRVVRGAGVEFESTLPFAGLHQLLRRFTGRLDCLPAEQRQALRAALGLGSAAGGDRFMVGLAVLTLLADLAEEQPLLCLMDDAHWLDQSSAEALLFAARRLEAERVAIIFAARDMHAPEFSAPGLAELRLSRLDGTAAAALLAPGCRPAGARGLAGRTGESPSHRAGLAGPRGRGPGHGRRPAMRPAQGALDPVGRCAVPR